VRTLRSAFFALPCNRNKSPAKLPHFSPSPQPFSSNLPWQFRPVLVDVLISGGQVFALSPLFKFRDHTNCCPPGYPFGRIVCLSSRTTPRNTFVFFSFESPYNQNRHRLSSFCFQIFLFTCLDSLLTTDDSSSRETPPWGPLLKAFARPHKTGPTTPANLSIFSCRRPVTTTVVRFFVKELSRPRSSFHDGGLSLNLGYYPLARHTPHYQPIWGVAQPNPEVILP